MDTQIAVSHEEETGSFDRNLMSRIALESILLEERGFSAETVDAVAELAWQWNQVDLPPRPRQTHMVLAPSQVSCVRKQG